MADQLRAAGFADGYKGLTFRLYARPSLERVPEGDTIHRLAARLRPVLAGQPLVRLELARPSRSGLRPPGPGTMVEAVEARASTC